MRPPIDPRLLIPLLVSSAWACRNGDRKPAPAVANAAAEAPAWRPARTAELFFSTELDGYVEPCGCTSEPLGGLQRLATVVGRSEVPHGLIDAGNLLFPTEWDDLTRPQHLLKSHIVARAYRNMGALALNVAPADLMAGADHLLALQQEGAVPFVSANVRPRKHGPEIARSFIRTVGGVRFGITGVALPEAVAQVSRDVAVIEYAPALNSELEAMRKGGAEVVVVLAHLGEAAALELARLIPRIDVIVRAPGTPIERKPSPPKQVGPVLVVEAGSQGQHVGRLRFALGPDAPPHPIPLDDRGAKAARRRALDEKSLAAARVQREAWSKDPSQAEAVRALDDKIARLEAKLAAPVAEAAPPEGPHVRVDLLPLSVDIEGDDTVKALLAGYYQQLQKMNLEQGDVTKCAPKAGKPTFVGTAKCAQCHEEAFTFWQGTKHAKAWETLEEDGKQYDLTCVGCHVVGYQQAGGFCRIADVAGYEDVGCENCHGPGSAHVDSEDPDDITLAAPVTTCASSCHVPEHSDAFHYETYLDKITGPGHERSEG